MLKKHALTFMCAAMLFSVMVLSGCEKKVQRFGMCIGIPKENIAEYEKLHAACWPGVLKQIRSSNIENCSIYLGEVEAGQYYLFSFFEYRGSDFAGDMKKMDKDKTSQEWRKHTDPLQKPLDIRRSGEWWANWQEVFHYSGTPYKGKPTRRVGSIISIVKENILVYTQMHASVWPGVLASIDRCNIRNYTIYLGEISKDKYILFSYFEYIGDDFDGDMKNIGDEVTKKWWTYTDPLQSPLTTRKQGEWWATMQEVFHTD